MDTTIDSTLATESSERAAARDRDIPAAVIIIALFKVILHLATTGRFGYEYFVDELYFLSTAQHLAWGYVDMPPLFPVVTAGVVGLVDNSLLAIRLLPALAGGALVVMTALVARAMGGGRTAQILASAGVFFAPIYLVMHSIHTMNALEPLFWTGAALILIRILKGGDERLWLLFGVISGVGLLNKHTMALYGIGAVVGIMSTGARRAFSGRWIWLGGAVALVVFLPNLIWMASNGFPHLEMLANIRSNGRNVDLGAFKFILEQILIMHPLAAPLWIAGLLSLLANSHHRRFRPLGIAWLTVLGILLVTDGRVYYMAPAYPPLLAAGGAAFERWATAQGRKRMLVAWAGLVTLTGAILAPTVLPMLPPSVYPQYARFIGLDQPRIETHKLGPLPQLFADRFGWREMAETVARAYGKLTPGEKANVAIFGQNYGQAGAIDLYGPALGLPKPISGHLAWHDWGPRRFTGEIMIVMDDDREVLERYFEHVEWAGRVEHPYSMPYQHFDVWICRNGREGTLTDWWPMLRKLE